MSTASGVQHQQRTLYRVMQPIQSPVVRGASAMFAGDVVALERIQQIIRQPAQHGVNAFHGVGGIAKEGNNGTGGA